MSQLIRLPLQPLRCGLQPLPSAAGRYLARVRRVAVGEAFVVFDPSTQQQAEARRIEDREQQVWIEVGMLEAAEHVVTQPLIVVQSWPKGSKLDGIVRAATELAASHLLLVRSERSVPTRVSPSQLQRLRRIAVEAARQCGRGDVPIIEVEAEWSQALAQCRPWCAQGVGVQLQPDAAASLAQVLAASLAQGLPAIAATYPVVLAIGPEGGFAPQETAALTAAGFHPARLGPFVMRTETAAVAGLAAVLAGRKPL